MIYIDVDIMSAQSNFVIQGSIDRIVRNLVHAECTYKLENKVIDTKIQDLMFENNENF